MKQICRELQGRLAVDGPAVLREDREGQQHVADCPSCFAFLETISQLQQGLNSLASVDAPDSVVETLLARPELTRAPEPRQNLWLPAGGWLGLRSLVASWMRPTIVRWGSAVAAILLLMVFFTDQERYLEPEKSPLPLQEALDPVTKSTEGFSKGEGLKQAGAPPVSTPKNFFDLREHSSTTGTLGPARKAKENFELERGGGLDLQGKLDQDRFDNLEQEKAQNERFEELGKMVLDQSKTEIVSGDDLDTKDAPQSPGYYGGELNRPAEEKSSEENHRLNLEGSRQRDLEAARSESLGRKKDVVPAGSRRGGVGGVPIPQRIRDSYVAPVYPEGARRRGIEARVVLRLLVGQDGGVDQVTVLECDRPDLGFEEAAVEAARKWRYQPARVDGRPVTVWFTTPVIFTPPSDGQGRRIETDPTHLAIQSARAFLGHRALIEGLQFQHATGYWSNSYVPGDPALRLLQSRLGERIPSDLQGYAQGALRLHNASHQVAQPFDAPDKSALAVYLHADRRGISGRSRTLLQVGLKGTPKYGGRRPAMNISLVLDLRGEIPKPVALGLRALLDAFNQASEPGDCFRVVAAGKPGAMVIDPRHFRHGYIQVTLDRLLSGKQQASGPTLGLVAALGSAIRSVAASDDPNAPLGSSAVILITSQQLGEKMPQLADLASQGAIAGVPLSVVGVGEGVELEELDRLVLAGQGQRRLLEGPEEAVRLVARELAAVGRVIARAIRLRIRLAPGVQLVDVLGSQRLDEVRSQRVREAERAIDLRLARNLGIEADRGEDEKGIQIVIPTFYAEASHVVLLDLVASGPGPVADVTVRYKDLVYLRNGLGKASFDLSSVAQVPGPLERNVLKNLLSLRLSQTLEQAGSILLTEGPGPAMELLAEARTLLLGLGLEVPGLGQDPEVANDVAMLREYCLLLESELVMNPQHLAHLSDSLLHAARLKVLSSPLENPS